MLNRIERLREQASVRLNMGSGDANREGVINIDLHGSPDLKADARSLPVRTSSVDWVESHHMLEHFTLIEGEKVMSEWQRVLKPGGWLFVTLPNILGMIPMMQNAHSIPEVWNGISMFIYGLDGPGMRHLSAYSPHFLKFKLERFGFKSEDFPWNYRPTPSFGVLACLG